MKFSVSNIAWNIEEEDKLLDFLASQKVSGIEVAPTKICPKWQDLSLNTFHNYRTQLDQRGFSVPALQAVLFGKPELQVFKPETHKDFFAHIATVADIAEALAAPVIVFGAPKNRLRGSLSDSKTQDIANHFFQSAAEICHERGCCIGLEHNPKEYSCDYLTNVSEVVELVDQVNHPGLQVHVDSAGLHMTGGLEQLNTVKHFCHYHISEPMLEPIANGKLDHNLAIELLRKKNYAAWVSIEMKQPETQTQLKSSVSLISDLLFGTNQ